MEAFFQEYPFRCVLSLKPLIDYLNTSSTEPGCVKRCMSDDVLEMIKTAPELSAPIENVEVLKRHPDIVQRLMSLVFSPVNWDTEAVAAVVPISTKPIFVSPLFRRLFLNEEGDFIGRMNLDDKSFSHGRAIRAYLFILEKFYGIHESLDYPVIYIVPVPDTGLDRHFKISFDFRFVEARAVNEPKVLTDEERASIREHLTDPEVLREILPPEDFELHGFTLFQAMDVTESEIISALERDLIEQKNIVSRDGFQKIQERLRILFRRPGLVAGLDALKEDQVLQISSGCEMSHCCIFKDSRHIPISEFEGTFYHKALQGHEVIRIPDVHKECAKDHCEPKAAEKEMLQAGIRSLMIAPLHFQETSIGIFHLGSPTPGDFGPMDALLMSRIQPLFSMATKRALDDLDNQVQRIIKEKCTAVHPSVEWRFQKAAFQHLENLRLGRPSEIGPIVFKDVYPLYGVSDIRGSTHERNRAIQRDLSDHLNLARNVILAADEAKSLLILRELAGRVDGHLKRIQAGLGTGDESTVLKFLREEVESVFPNLRGFGLKVIRAIENYESAMDPYVGTVFGLRKDFEESVSILNDRLTTYLDQEEENAQDIFPHYFERHRTDGVDYLIYMGASLMENEEFTQLYLKNLRLWQIKVACGMAWHTEQLKSTLKVPLDTAHLVLVQDAPLSIRFRFDEKRFDVDGAYDIRQEIIKSRLDKALIKGGGERLTQPEKIAIVYSRPDEELEIRHHIDFLRSEGYLNGELEKLELDELQGVQGLKSIRVGVDMASQALSEKVGQIIEQSA